MEAVFVVSADSTAAEESGVVLSFREQVYPESKRMMPIRNDGVMAICTSSTKIGKQTLYYNSCDIVNYVRTQILQRVEIVRRERHKRF